MEDWPKIRPFLSYPRIQLDSDYDPMAAMEQEVDESEFEGKFNEDFETKTLHDLTLMVLVRDPTKYDEAAYDKLIGDVHKKLSKYNLAELGHQRYHHHHSYCPPASVDMMTVKGA